MRSLYIAILIVAAVGLIGYGVMRSSNNNTDQVSMMESEKMDKDVMTNGNLSNEDKMMDDKASDDSMMKDDAQKDSMSDDSMMKAGEYRDYDPSLLSRADSGKVVLFFHASWCPTCKVLNSALNASLSDIPEDVTILKVDYDSSTELKKKYGITYQHTLVQVDSRGNQLTKWNGGSDLNSILTKLQ